MSFQRIPCLVCSISLVSMETNGLEYAMKCFHMQCARHPPHLLILRVNVADPWSESNLPVYGMWVYTLATTLLITADGLDYYGVESAEVYVKYGQIFGATLLGVGSLMYCYWSRSVIWMAHDVFLYTCDRTDHLLTDSRCCTCTVFRPATYLPKTTSGSVSIQ